MRVTIVTAIFAAFPGLLAAQAPEPLVRVETGTCRQCTLALEHVATVGSPEDKELLLDGDALLALDGGGFLAHGPEGLLRRYDAAGRYIGTVGKEGAGPGEYRGKQAVGLARGDSVTVFSYGRFSTLSTTSGAGRSGRLPVDTRAFRLLTLPDGSWVINNYMPPTKPFVLAGADGAVLAEFGEVAGRVGTRSGHEQPDFDAQQFVMAPASGGGFWSARMHDRHLIERWSNRGERIRQIARQPAWWPTYTPQARMEAMEGGFGWTRPLPRMLSIWTDQGRLFTLSLLPDAKWQRDPNALPPDVRQGESNPEGPTGGIARYLDFLIEAYDESSGAHLGSWRADAFPGIAIGHGMLGNPTQDEFGYYRHEVWRVVLQGQ